MRALRLTLSGVLVGAVCAAAVHGQDSVRQPASLQQTSFNEYKYNSYYEQDGSAAPRSRRRRPRRSRARPRPLRPAPPATPAATPATANLLLRLRRLPGRGPADPQRSALPRLQAGGSQACCWIISPA